MTEPLDPANEPSEIVAETGAGHSATMTEIGVGAPAGGRRRVITAATAAVVILVSGVAAWAFWPSPSEPEAIVFPNKTSSPAGDMTTTPGAAPTAAASPQLSAASTPVDNPNGADVPARPQPATVINPPPGVTTPAMPTDLYLVRRAGTYDYHYEWVDRSNNEKGFTVYFNDGSQANVEANTYWHERQNLPPNTTICFAVAAYNAAGHSPVTDWLCTTTPPPPPTTPPAAPSNTRYSLTGGTSIRVEWTDNAADEETFEIRVIKAGVTLPYVVRGANTLTYQLDLERGVAHCFDVRATNVAGASAWSNSACVTLPTFPAAPSDLRVTPIGGGVRVEWTDNSNNEDNFRLTASIASTPAVFRNLLLPANTTSYDLVAPAGTRVCASVSAVNGAGPVSGGQVCITTPAS